MIDLYSNYHLTYQLTSLEENIAYQISQFARSFVPTYRTNFSPFEPRKRAVASTISGQSSIAAVGTSSQQSSSDESESPSDEDETTLSFSLKSPVAEQREVKKPAKIEDNVEQTCQKLYGFELHQPDKESLGKYKSYVNIQKKSQPGDKKSKPFILKSLATYNDSFESVTEPVVKVETIEKYQNYCNLMINKNYDSTSSSLALIEKYVNFVQ